MKQSESQMSFHLMFQINNYSEYSFGKKKPKNKNQGIDAKCICTKVMHNKPKVKVFCFNSLKMHRDISIRMKSIHNAQWQTFMNSCARGCGGRHNIAAEKAHNHC